MASMKGRTLSPSDGELVYVINENADVPPSQRWLQYWEWCVDDEVDQRVSLKAGTSGTVRFTNRAFTIQERDYANLVLRLGPSHFTMVASEPAGISALEPRDLAPTTRCSHQEYSIRYSLPDLDVAGDGDSEVSTEGCLNDKDNNPIVCDTISIWLRLQGTNPTYAMLSAALGTDVFRAIAWDESSWHQFWTDKKPYSHANINGSTDWGVMQVNNATDLQRWNWRENVAAGKAIFAEKEGYARKYLNTHPPYTDDMLLNETLQKYNAGQKRTYYQWDEDTAAWVAYPFNGYADRVRRFMADKPWLRHDPESTPGFEEPAHGSQTG